MGRLILVCLLFLVSCGSVHACDLIKFQARYTYSKCASSEAVQPTAVAPAFPCSMAVQPNATALGVPAVALKELAVPAGQVIAVTSSNVPVVSQVNCTNGSCSATVQSSPTRLFRRFR